MKAKELREIVTAAGGEEIEENTYINKNRTYVLCPGDVGHFYVAPYYEDEPLPKGTKSFKKEDDEEINYYVNV